MIVVNHVVPTLPIFLEGLQHIANVAAVIPKGSANDHDVRSVIEKSYCTLSVTREQLNGSGAALALLGPFIKDGKKCIMLTSAAISPLASKSSREILKREKAFWA